MNIASIQAIRISGRWAMGAGETLFVMALCSFPGVFILSEYISKRLRRVYPPSHPVFAGGESHHLDSLLRRNVMRRIFFTFHASQR
jgi:hypothetical protein